MKEENDYMYMYVTDETQKEDWDSFQKKMRIL